MQHSDFWLTVVLWPAVDNKTLTDVKDPENSLWKKL